jgi:hypothetical protein
MKTAQTIGRSRRIGLVVFISTTGPQDSAQSAQSVLAQPLGLT